MLLPVKHIPTPEIDNRGDFAYSGMGIHGKRGSAVREFDYFLYEVSDPDEAAKSTLNPRGLMNAETSAVLSAMIDQGEEGENGEALRRAFGRERIDRLMLAGFLREDGGKMRIAFPFFLREDAEILRAYCRDYAARLADSLMPALPACRRSVRRIENGYCEEINLYHVLCGMVLDGVLFDRLCENGLVLTHRRRPSGLDYILIAYEACEALDSFANKLLCSYNRFTDGRCALQSFGDADGDRHDLYRFARRLEAGKTTEAEAELCRLWREIEPDARGTLLCAAESLHRTGGCDPSARRLLTAFGYADEGGLCVPVYGAGAQDVVLELRDIVWNAVEGGLREALSAPPELDALACRRHGAAQGELNNELYHLLFGTVSGVLAQRGFVASPAYRPGEGRSLKSMELDL